MSRDLSRDRTAWVRQFRWERHMTNLCSLDNNLNAEIEKASRNSSELNRLVEKTYMVKDLWAECQRFSDDGRVLLDTAVQMAIDQHGLRSHDFRQPQSEAITVVSHPSSKPPDTDCNDVFNQAVSAAIVSNGLIAVTQKDN